MPASAALFALAKSPRAAISLLGCGIKVIRLGAQKMGMVGEAGEIQNSIIEVISSLGGNLAASQIDKHLDAMPSEQLEQANQHLVHFTGLVLQSLVIGALEQPEFESCKTQLESALAKLPEQWGVFVGRGITEAQPMAHQDFVLALAKVLQAHDTVEVIEPGVLSAFFAQWLEHCVSDVIVREGWHVKLAKAVAPGLGSGLAESLVLDHPTAEAAFKKSLLRFHAEEIKVLNNIDNKLSHVAAVQQEQVQQAQVRHDEVKSGLSSIEQMLMEQTASGRRAAYLKSLVSAFCAYQELALDNYAAADQTCPDIWDIFVHPACSSEHLRPEDMDKAQLETPPRLPAQELLPILGSATERRHVLLADPGMGKSTLVQSLIALIASGRSIVGAPALKELLPVPLILRDLVPLLPQAESEGWTWDLLLRVLIQNYCREENAPPLFQAWHGHEQEFRDLIHRSDQVFFLVDGLDEIGDLRKRKQIVQAIQEGIRTANVSTRWLITSRVIGYDEAPVDLILGRHELDRSKRPIPRQQRFDQWRSADLEMRKAASLWRLYMLPGSQWNEGPSEAVVDDWDEESKPVTKTKKNALPNPTLKMIGNGYVYRFRIARRLYLAPFDDKRQDLFTQRWFRHRHSTDYSTTLMREVRQHGHEGVRIIARVPNLLCMMNMLKRSGKPLPDGRAALYDEIVKAYLGGIESTFRNREAIGLVSPFGMSELRHLLSLLAEHMQRTRSLNREIAQELKRQEGLEIASLSEGNILISLPELESVLKPAIESMKNSGRLSSEQSSAQLLHDLLGHIAKRSGLLIPRSSDADGRAMYSFTHLSFLEFFVAEWLGVEFERHKSRHARQFEAMQDGLTLSDADLDREFPAPGPAYHRKDFPLLAANPSWHEPLIFLIESRPAESSTLLRWLFPALHSVGPTENLRSDGDEKNVPRPPMPLAAVQLAVKIGNDKELKLLPQILRAWFEVLWTAQLRWQQAMSPTDLLGKWMIAPVLLERLENQQEVIAALVEVWNSLEMPESPLPLFLNGCISLRSEPLSGLSQLRGLSGLWLSNCEALDNTEFLVGLRGLKHLDLYYCNGLQGNHAFQGLAGLSNLERLHLHGCSGLKDTGVLKRMTELKYLNLMHCTGLHGEGALDGLSEMIKLEALDLRGCAGLSNLNALSGLDALRSLDLMQCSGLSGKVGFKGLSPLTGLKNLTLAYCTGLEDTNGLETLTQLEELNLTGCTGLRGRESLTGLLSMKKLRKLFLVGCTGVTRDDVAWLRELLPADCLVAGLSF